jgi:hypothetical protein
LWQRFSRLRQSAGVSQFSEGSAVLHEIRSAIAAMSAGRVVQFDEEELAKAESSEPTESASDLIRQARISDDDRQKLWDFFRRLTEAGTSPAEVLGQIKAALAELDGGRPLQFSEQSVSKAKAMTMPPGMYMVDGESRYLTAADLRAYADGTNQAMASGIMIPLLCRNHRF